jgi:hypothetical protein
VKKKGANEGQIKKPNKKDGKCNDKLKHKKG